jgi:hypothetical protein
MNRDLPVEEQGERAHRPGIPSAGWRKMHDPRHSGARASPASPEPKNTGTRNQWAWPVCMGSRPGPDGPSRNDTRVFSSLLVGEFNVWYPLPFSSCPRKRTPRATGSSLAALGPRLRGGDEDDTIGTICLIRTTEPLGDRTAAGRPVRGGSRAGVFKHFRRKRRP